MDRPLVSIVVSTHDRVDLLRETMHTVFAQSYQPVEVVVVDDGSTDGTPELAASYGDRIRYHRHENRGIAGTRTVGGCLARGEYIAYQDDDDLMPPERIVVLLDALQSHPGTVMATGDWAIIDEQSKATGERSRFRLPRDRGPVLVQEGRRAVLWPELSPAPHTTLFRKVDGERIDWFDKRFFHSCEDTDFFARCADLGPIVYVPEVVSLYREGAGLSSRGAVHAYSRFLLFEKHLTHGAGRDPKLDRRLKERLLGTLRRLASLQQTGDGLPDAVDVDRVRAGIRLLGLDDRLAYGWSTLVRLPLGRVARRILGRQMS